ADELCRGVQVAWEGPDGAATVAVGHDGLGRPVRPDTVFAVCCAAKPLLAIAVAGLCEMGVLADLDVRLPELCPTVDGADVSLRSLLDHTAGLHAADGEHLKLRSAAGQLGAALVARCTRPGWDPSTQAGYSELIAWQLVALAVEAATGTSWVEVVEELVVGPTGGHPDVHVHLRPDVDADRVGTNLDLRGRARPLLNETAPSFRAPNPAYGCFATAAGLTRVLHALATEPSTVGRSVLDQPGRGRRRDEVMQTVADARPGLLLDLPDYGVVGAAPGAFGHTGLMGLTTILHGPTIATTATITFVGLIDGPTSVGVRRPRLLRLLGP
ncbi:MAG TPA: serine hydrolase domain-containing protein, partial [Iamia sp.]|nr:serine hydrolase domain-containing protein [Iamia sp.]